MFLQTVWFFLWGLLWAVFFILDGFDFGCGILYPFIGKNEIEKKNILSSIGPFWNGNEVWLITAGGVTFAAFPQVYATMFSSLYSALMFILFALILRGIALEFRYQSDNILWNKIWDFSIFIGSFLPALLFGTAFANFFQGLPIDGDKVYHGNLLSLLNPYGILGGIFFLLLFLQHGALWLSIKTDNDIKKRVKRLSGKIWTLLLIIAVIFLILTKFYTNLYDNYVESPVLFIIPLITVLGLLGIRFFIAKNEFLKAWLSSALTILGAVFFGIIGLFPNMLVSNIDISYSLTAFNSSSSELTLKIMLIVVLIFLPIVILYQAWAYNLFKK